MAAPQVPFVPLMAVTGVIAIITSNILPYPVTGAISSAYALVLPVWLFYTCWIYPFYLSPLRHVPTVPGFPLWGQTYELITQPIGVPVRRWHAELGPIIRFLLPFGTESLSVIDDDATTQIMTRNIINYPKPLRLKAWMESVLGNGMLFAEGAEHTRQKKALSPGFSLRSVRASLPTFWSKAFVLTQLWQEELMTESVKAKSIEVTQWLNRATMDITGAIGLGTEFDTLRNPTAPILEAYRLILRFDFVSNIIHGLNSFFPIVGQLPTKVNRDMLKARNIILKTSSDIVIEKTEQAMDKDVSKRGRDIVSLFVQQNLKAKEADRLSFELSCAEVMLILSSYDTTTAGAAWTVFLVAKYPEVQKRLRAEIRQHMPFLFDPKTRTNAELLETVDPDALPYLTNVCLETLRFIPPTPLTVRQSVKPDILGGYEIPGGVEIFLFSCASNLSPDFWGPTAEIFDPDRWDNLPPTYRQNAFQTFLQGTRRCPGRKFAELELKTLLCALLSMYTFEPDRSMEDPEKNKIWRIVHHPRNGINLIVKPLGA